MLEKNYTPAYSVFKTISGDIQVKIGYQHFFLWVLVSAIPVVVMSLWIVPKETGEQEVIVEDEVVQ